MSLYIVGNWETGSAMLECHHEECMVPGNCPAGLCFWTEDLPHEATLGQVAEAYARHLASHGEPVQLGRTYRAGESFTVTHSTILHPLEP